METSRDQSDTKIERSDIVVTACVIYSDFPEVFQVDIGCFDTNLSETARRRVAKGAISLVLGKRLLNGQQDWLGSPSQPGPGQSVAAKGLKGSEDHRRRAGVLLRRAVLDHDVPGPRHSRPHAAVKTITGEHYLDL
jgi:hypothetical protein